MNIIVTGNDQSDIDAAANLVGATATVNLPVFPVDIASILGALDAADDSETIYTEGGSILSGKRILVVEDNKINMEIAAEMLRIVGAHVDKAYNGREAVDIFKNSIVNKYDLILMDIRMPEMDGFQATRAIRSIKRSDAESIIIIAVTANTFPEDVEECLKAGMNSHVGKPFILEDIEQSYCECLERFAEKYS